MSADTSEINRISDLFIQRMALYLVSVMKANDEIAKDCAQQAFEKVYTRLLQGSVTDVDDIFGYLIRSARNEYRMILREEGNKLKMPNEYSNFAGITGATEEVITGSIFWEEKEKLLEYCIEKLRESRRVFFLKVLKFINEDDKEVAEKLNMSHGNFRTRKSRVIDALRDCVKNAAHQ